MITAMIATPANAEWNARPVGYTLTAPSIVGSIEDGRTAIEKIKAQEAKIELTENALTKIENQVRIISVALSEAQGQIKEVPNLIKQAEVEFAKTLRKEKAKSAGTGAIIGILVGAGAALLF